MIRRAGYTLVELLIVVGIVATIVGLILPAVMSARAVAARAGCLNHLRQLALAAHNSAATSGQLPPGTATKNDQYVYLSWQARLLPHLGQSALWSQTLAAYRLSVSPFDVAPKTPLGTAVEDFLCPSDDYSRSPQKVRQFTVAFTDYLGNAGTDSYAADGVLYANSRIAFTDIADGLSHTLLAVERPPGADYNYGWWFASSGQDGGGSADVTLGVREYKITALPRYRRCPRGPYHFRPGLQADRCAVFHFWSNHPGGANAAFCDGSVRFLPYSADNVLPALATRAAGDIDQLP